MIGSVSSCLSKQLWHISMYWVVGFGIPQTCTRWTIVMYWDIKTESTCVAFVFEKYKSLVSWNVSVYMYIQILHLSWVGKCFLPSKNSVQAGSASNCTACYDAHGRTLKDSECICPKGGMAIFDGKRFPDEMMRLTECGWFWTKRGLAKEDILLEKKWEFEWCLFSHEGGCDLWKQVDLSCFGIARILYLPWWA